MSKRVALSISLTAQLAEFIAEKVRSGRYGSASEVVRMSLRLLEEKEPAEIPSVIGSSAVKVASHGR